MVGNDFLSFYSVATMEWRHSAADAFDLARLTQLQSAISGTGLRLPFPYPPPFLLYVAPLAAMPYLTALYFWIGATAAPFVWIARKLPPDKKEAVEALNLKGVYFQKENQRIESSLARLKRI